MFFVFMNWHILSKINKKKTYWLPQTTPILPKPRPLSIKPRLSQNEQIMKELKTREQIFCFDEGWDEGRDLYLSPKLSLPISSITFSRT